MTKNITPNNNINQIDFLLQVSQSLLTYGKHNILQASVNTCRNKDAPTLMTTLKKARRSIVINGLVVLYLKEIITLRIRLDCLLGSR